MKKERKMFNKVNNSEMASFQNDTNNNIDDDNNNQDTIKKKPSLRQNLKNVFLFHV